MNSNKLKYKVVCLVAAAKRGDVNVIAHQTNCMCNMGSGIAPVIAGAFPEAREADNATEKGDDAKLGHFTHSIGRVVSLPRIEVFNLYGQYAYGEGNHTNYTHLRGALRGMAFYLINAKNIVRVGLPKLGSDRGGGDWEIIERIIIEELIDRGIDVTIYVLEEEEIPMWSE